MLCESDAVTKWRNPLGKDQNNFLKSRYSILEIFFLVSQGVKTVNKMALSSCLRATPDSEGRETFHFFFCHFA